MNSVISIRPSKDLRTGYADISKLARENPVAITVNGKEDIVVMSHEDYMEQQKYISTLERRLALYDHLAQAFDDVKLGRLQVMSSAFDVVLGDINQMEASTDPEVSEDEI